MSVIVPKTQEEFNKHVSTAYHEQKLVVIDFMATWCGPCKALAPLFTKLADHYKQQAVFLKIDVDVHEDLAAAFKVSAMPTIVVSRLELSEDKKSIVFKDVYKHTGSAEVPEFLEKHLSKVAQVTPKKTA